MFLQEQCEINELEFDYTNSFFQTIIRQKGVFIKYFPPQRGGSPLDIEEFRDYMNAHKIKFDPMSFSKQIFSAKTPILMKTENTKMTSIPEKMIIRIKENGIRAVCRFIPPSTGGEELEKDDILEQLHKFGIKYGIIEENIDKFLSNKKYGTDFVFAKGIEPINGHDAEIIYKFNINRNRKPKERKDGTVDFLSIDIIPKVEEGDILAELIRENEGSPGTDVKGNNMLPLKVKRLDFKYGNNVSVSEDGLFLLSNVPGHVVLEGDKISVSNTFSVNGDVDVSTGNIDYDGNVDVKGSVISGITLTATGDITIDGTVEGATIIAGGHIILKGGTKGMGKGSLKAGGNIVAKFLESVEVSAGGYVTADSILNSNIAAKEDINVNNRKGYVNGGHIISATAIKVKNAGSEMGTKTILEVGIDPDILSEIKNTELKIEWLIKKMENALPMIEFYGKKLKRGEFLQPEKLLQFKIMTLGYKKHSDELEENKMRLSTIMEEISDNNSGYVEITDVCYPGVKIVVADVAMSIKTITRNSKFIRDGADVRIAPIY